VLASKDSGFGILKELLNHQIEKNFPSFAGNQKTLEALILLASSGMIWRPRADLNRRPTA
jgi:hypothetical protein